MSSETNALEAKGGVGKEAGGREGETEMREWRERERKSVGNFNLPRVTKRLATPSIATVC